ncbi:glycosyltransferase, partial
MKENPLVTVVMNCYNGEKYLQKAIESVLSQTYSNWEIIFWDNQSHDKSA